MSADPSPPPSPDDAIQNWLTKAETLIALIVENLRRGTWVKRLLLLDALVVFALNTEVFTRALRIFAILSKDEALPDWYGAAFWATVGVLFLTALLVALFTSTAAKVETIDLSERKAIKGLRPFTANDTEIFTKLQRNRSLRECLESITSENFRFGILMGESGCGKTSFLQAGIVPNLSDPEADYRAVYVRFSDRPPLNAIREDLSKQLHIPKENLNSTDLVMLLRTAVDAIDQPLILCFDQFEQFFVHAPRKPDRQLFIQALTDWYQSDLPARVLVCMRGDMVDRLVELHQALGYALSPQEVFRLEKFSPEEATRVLQVIAETEKLRFEESFVKELTQRELADREDGTISPVDLQILGWMIERQNAEELRAFNQQAFQKFGGVEGLMTRFLEKTLEARVVKSQREAAVKVLLALTDLDRNVRAGALSLTELQDKLKDTVKANEVAEAVGWLVRGDVRLITPEEKAEETTYELAHERLIPAVRKVAGKELTEVQKANELLDRRVNEWQGNQFSSRYLFSPIELWRLKRQQPYLEWGANRRQKEQLWRKSWRRFYRIVGALVLVLLLLLSGWGWLLTPTGQRWQMWRELATVSQRVNDEGRATAVAAFAKNKNFQQANQLSDSIQDEYDKVNALSSIAEASSKLNNSQEAIKLLNDALATAQTIQYESSKANALISIAEASSKLNNSQEAIKLLNDALAAAQSIQDEFYKARALSSIAEASSKLNNSQEAIKLLNDALAAAQQIQDEYYTSDAASWIAESYAKLDHWRQARQAVESCSNNGCRVETLAAALTVWAERQHPELAELVEAEEE